MNVGQLHVTLSLLDDQFRQKMGEAEASARKFDQTAGATARSTAQIGAAGQQAGQQLGNGLRGGASQADSLSMAVGKAKTAVAALGIAFGAKQAINFFTSAIADARALSAQTNQMNVLFGESKATIEAWGKTANTALAMSQREAQGAAIQFASFGDAAGLSGDKLAKFSMGMTKLAAETASFNGVAAEEVIAAMGSAMQGQAIPMRKYGVLLSEAALQEVAFRNGITQSIGPLNAREKILATQIALHEGLKSVEGDIDRSRGKYGQNLKIMKARYEEVSAAIGGKLMPIANSFVQMLSGPGLAALSTGGDALGVLVKMIEKTVGAFVSLPGPIQAALAGVVAFKLGTMALGTAAGTALTAKLAAAGTAVMGFGRGSVQATTGYLGALRQAFVYAGGGAGSLSGSLKAAGTVGVSAFRHGLGSIVNFLGGPWMIAMAAGAAALGAWMQHNSKIKAGQAEVRDAAKSVAEAMQITEGKSAGAADKVAAYTQKAAAAALEQIKVASTGETLAAALDRIGVSGERAAQGLAGSKEAAQDTLRALSAKAEEEKQRQKERSNVSGVQAMWNWVTTGETGDAPQQEYLKKYQAALAEVEAQQKSLKREAANSGLDLSEARDGTVALSSLSEAMQEFEANTAGAAAGVDILTKALVGLTNDQLTLHDAQAKVNEGWRDMADLKGTLGEVGLDGAGLIDTTSEAGAKADKAVREQSENYKQLASAMFEAGVSGEALTNVLRPQYEQFLQNVEAMGMTREQAESVAAALGMFPEKVETELGIKNEANIKTLLDSIKGQVEDFDNTTGSIKLEALTDEAESKLKAMGWTVDRIPGEKEVTVTPNSTAAMAALAGVRGAVDGIPEAKPITIETPGYENVMSGLKQLGIEVHANNEKQIVIEDNSPETMAKLRSLNIAVTTLEDGTVVITDNSRDVKGNIYRNLNGLQTSGTHTVTVREIAATNFQNNVAASVAAGQRPHYADGGLRQRAFGALDEAQIQAGSGNGRFQTTPLGDVQWAEAAAGPWEAFIPGAPSKRRRGLQILAETARRMGQLLVPRHAVMADGGIRGGGLDDFARGIEGQKYTFGGSGSWNTDCSGGVSAVVNKATGRDPFGSRTSTATMGAFLAERGFLPGSGGPGDLSVGWLNGGPGGGHTALTLPSGVNVEMGGARGDGQYGGQAAGANDPMFTDRMHLPGAMVQGGDAGNGIEGVSRELGEARAALAAATTDEDRAAAQSRVDLLEAKMEGYTAAAGSGQAVWVTNWPAGLGGASISMSSGGGGSYGGGDSNQSALADMLEDNEPAVDHQEIARLTMTDGAQKAAEAMRDSLLSDLGLSGDGFLSQLFKQGPEIDRLFREQADEDRENGVTINHHWNVTLADQRALAREVEGETRRALYQFGGGRN